MAALEESAAGAGWRIAASGAVAEALQHQAQFGRAARTRRGDEASEVLGLFAT